MKCQPIAVSGLLLIFAMVTRAFAQNDVIIQDPALQVLRVADKPLKDFAGGEMKLDLLREVILRFDFTANVDLRDRSHSWQIGGHAELCEWHGQSWEIPVYAADFVYDDFGMIVGSDQSWYGLPIGSKAGSKRYHFYVDTKPATVPDNAKLEDFDMMTNPQRLCISLRLSNGENLDVPSNTIEVSPGELKKMLSSTAATP